MKTLGRWMFFSVLLFLVACATPTTGMTKIAAGDKPSIEAANRVIYDYLKSTLKDPDSLKSFRIYSDPVLISWYRGVLDGGGNEQGWLHCFEYNAKNSFGGYVGVKKDGYVLRTYPDGDVYVVRHVNWALASAKCW